MGSLSRGRQEGGHVLEDSPLPVTRADASLSPYQEKNTESTIVSRIFRLTHCG